MCFPKNINIYFVPFKVTLLRLNTFMPTLHLILKTPFCYGAFCYGLQRPAFSGAVFITLTAAKLCPFMDVPVLGTGKSHRRPAPVITLAKA